MPGECNAIKTLYCILLYLYYILQFSMWITILKESFKNLIIIPFIFFDKQTFVIRTVDFS